MTDPYSPSPELVEAASDAWWAVGPIAYEARWRAFCCAAVAFRHPDGHPELVPWDEYTALLDDCIAAMERIQGERDRLEAQVRELVDAAWASVAWFPAMASPEAQAARQRVIEALAPFTQEPEA